MSREDGYGAMKVEADALKAGKPPKEVGYIDRDGNSFRAHVEFREEGGKRNIPVTGGPPLQGVLSLYPFGIKDGPSDITLAMHPPIGFACQFQGHINEERRSLSDAPSASLVRRLPKNHGGIFPSSFP